jgi:hypothetical protein
MYPTVAGGIGGHLYNFWTGMHRFCTVPRRHPKDLGNASANLGRGHSSMLYCQMCGTQRLFIVVLY